MLHRKPMILLFAAVLGLSAHARSITVHAHEAPAAEVFSEIMGQTKLNFVYPAELLAGKKFSIDIRDANLRQTLDELFRGTDIVYSKKGRNIILTRKPSATVREVLVSGFVREAGTNEPLIGALVEDSIAGHSTVTNAAGYFSFYIAPGRAEITAHYPGFEPRTVSTTLNSPATIEFELAERKYAGSTSLGEVVVVADRNKALAMNTADVGHLTLSGTEIAATPVIFGEPDVIKTLQLQPGVTAGTEGLAGMYVHGGAHDENLYLLDNVPLYQVNHFAGLFSAFNHEAISNVDFYKTSFPARYNGRLSSVLDVHTKDGSSAGHHGSLRVGLTSGAFNIDGPVTRDGRTTYSAAIRRSWYDVLTIPALAIYNSVREDKSERTIAGFAFTDLNAKITHRFSDRSTVHAMFYYGEDYLKGGSKSIRDYEDNHTEEKTVAHLRWGNIVAKTGWNYLIGDRMFMELSGSFSRYASRLKHEDIDSYTDLVDGKKEFSHHGTVYTTKNRIEDWSARADFNWNNRRNNRTGFGAAYTYHHYTPRDHVGEVVDSSNGNTSASTRSTVNAHEGQLYISDDWEATKTLRINAGLNFTLFGIAGGETHANLNPRVSARWKVSPQWAVKAAYARMSQYVHQLTETVLSLPTDSYVPISGDLRPQTSDKVSVGAYFDLDASTTISAEAYYKWSRDIIDYRDDYYLFPTDGAWMQQLCTGRAWAKGVDLMLSRHFGRVSGHVAYSLMWVDHQFADKNHGEKYPARFDNRHTINIVAFWKINDKWELSASWTGQSGNRVTLYTQDYELLPVPDMPSFGDPSWEGFIPLNGKLNSKRLPFYHRLDIGVTRNTKHGFWNFSLFNAYCNMNVIGIRRTTVYNWDTMKLESKLEKMRLLPIIPSVSYTWKF